MIRFLDGPARDQMMILDRTPVLLRVTRCTVSGRWDALDQLNDRPASFEEIHVYRRDGKPGVMFLDYRTPGGFRRGTRKKTATYRLLDEQPPDATLRDNAAWQAWCRQWAARNPAKETTEASR